MDFELTEEQKQMKVLIKDFCQREVDPKRMKELVDKATTAKTIEELRAIQPLDLLEKLHEVGLHQLCVPAKYGGGDVTHCGNATRAVAAEEFGYWAEPLARSVSKIWNLCSAMAIGKSAEEQKDWFFSEFMEDHTMQLGAVVSEPSGATDIHLPYDEPGVAMKTFAYKDGDEWVINGDKMFSHAGGVAGLIRVPARTDKHGPLSKSVTSFWVWKDTPGMTMIVNRMIIGELAGNVQTHFENVRVPEIQMIGEVNSGSGGVESYAFATKMVLWAELIGAARRLYEQIVEYAKERVQGGRPIIEHPNIAAMLGEIAVNLEATRSFLYRAAWECDQREKARAPLNMFWTQGVTYLFKKMGLQLCEVASEIYGGIGGSVDMPLESFVRHLYLLLAGGSTTNMNAIKCSMEYNAHKIG